MDHQILDVPDAHRGKSDTWAILGVIMGGDKPTSMDGYLMPMFQDLQAALGDDPRGHMFLRYQGPNDGRPHAEPRLIPILISLVADTPARATMTKGLPHMAGMGCFWCWLKTAKEDNAIHPKGYATPVPTPVVPALVRPPVVQEPGEAAPPAPSHVHMWEPVCRVTNEEMRLRGELVESGHLTQSDAGCIGVPIVCKYFEHVQPSWAHVVPTGHSLLFGLVKSHLKWVFAPGSPFRARERRLMKARFGHLMVPTEYGRKPYHHNKCSGWIMESFMHFIKHEWAYVFKGIMTKPEHAKHLELWRCLVSASLHYLTPGADTPETVLENIETAYANLKKYAVGMQEFQEELKAPDTTFSPNLHMLICRLYLQELERGRSFRDAEFWVERLMQYVKLWAGKHSPGCSKGLISCLRDQVHRGVKRFAAMRPDAADAEEQRAGPKRARLVGPGRDPISVADAQVQEGQQCQLVGAGSLRCPVPDSEERVRQACCITVGEMNRGREQHSGWEPADVNALFPTASNVPGEAAVPPARPGLVRYYTRAMCTQQKMNSVAYRRAVKRPSTWVLAQYFHGGSTEKINKYAAHIEFWVRLEHPDHPGHFLRLAIARLVRLHPQAAPAPRPAAPTAAAPPPKRKQMVSDVNPDQWYGIDGELLHTMLVCAFPDGEGKPMPPAQVTLLIRVSDRYSLAGPAGCHRDAN
ncbi:hypothetical protein QJQ45_015428 [Haematococcus lacustris]|nr:hypothetical protein QJQ45_015428 [Haematococcus lacustris]